MKCNSGWFWGPVPVTGWSLPHAAAAGTLMLIMHTLFEIIDDLTHLVDKTDDRIRNETRRVKLVETKSASCGMLVVIVLLLIAIVVVAVWPV
ncbi:Syntaxin-8 [Dissostichus eleginoides]|uniref:Syntaxin-8 n=1 Tax=Dissostichus eleginoides TaxID=100907 RepID=A0AAD9EYX5_DISEL|nr:Syntaxin-8 [Dissostichus eleginoides]